MKKLLSFIFFMFLCCCFSLTVNAEECYHSNIYYSEQAKKIDDTYHGFDIICQDCHQKVGVQKSEHIWPEYTWTFRKKDLDSHIAIYKCIDCEATKEVVENHLWFKDGDYDDSRQCDFRFEYKRKNSTDHIKTYRCRCCDVVKKKKEKHSWVESVSKDGYLIYKNNNKTSHLQRYECDKCGERKWVEKSHRFNDGDCIRMATVSKPALIRYSCKICGATFDETETYAPDTVNSIDYLSNGRISDIYRNSKYITLNLAAPLKGGVIKIKIGKKTYIKKIKNTKKKIKVKIKPPKSKWGKKYTVKLIYKGKTLYSDWFTIWYAKNVKVGMTLKQVRYVRNWCDPDDITSRSGGWKFWHYEDGSMVTFKNGKVRSWRKA